VISMGTLDKELAAAVKRQEATEEQLDRQRRGVRDLVAKRELESHDEYQSLANQAKAVKRELHVCRLRQSRHRFSVDCREKRLDQAKRRLQEQLEVEVELVAKLGAIEADQDAIVGAVLRDVSSPGGPAA